jgi:tight adherence protein C
VTDVLVLLASTAVGLAAFFVAAAIFTPRRADATAARLDEISGPRDVFDVVEDDATTVWERLVQPLAAGTMDRAGAVLPARLGAYLEADLVAAGRPMTAGAFSALLGGLTVTCAGFALLLGMRGGSSMGMVLAVMVALVGFGIAAPIVWLRGRISRRQIAIGRSLPDTFDLVVVSVEAGLGLEAALARVVEDATGPLAEEIRHALSDMNLGAGRRRALQSMAVRVRVPAVRALVAAILQADQTGMGIGPVLRAQSEHLRTQRRQHAEERAMKAPLKMLFPLVFFIFPSLFVVMLGPAMISLMGTLGR